MKLSIALVGDGGSTHIQRLAGALAQRGHVVSVIAPDKRGPYPEIPGVKFYVFPSAEGPVKKLLRIRKILKEISPDVMHSHFVNHGGFIGLGTGYHPHLMSAWGCDVLNFPNESHFKFLQISLALRAADGLLPISNQIRDRMKEIGGKHPKTEVFNWGIDVERFSRTDEGAMSFRKRHDLVAKKIVFSPRLAEPLYNHTSLLHAWPEIKKRIPEARLVMRKDWGIAEYEESLRAIASDKGFAEDIVWLGALKLSELPEAYSAADVLVSIPRTDGTPMTVLEAMACGTPLVVCDIPALRDWIQPEKGGLLVQPDRSDQVADAVSRLLSASTEWKNEMAARNRQVVLERADSRKCLDALEEIYFKASANKGFSWLQTVGNLAGLWQDRKNT